MVKGISNLIADLMISLVVIGFFTAILSSAAHVTNSVKSYVSQTRQDLDHMGKCVLGWLITSNGSRGELVIGNPFNYSVAATILVNGLKKYEVHVDAHKILEITVDLGSNASNLMIVGSNGCVSRIQEVVLP